MGNIAFTVNGARHTVDTDPGRSLLEVLREDLDLTGSKFGCGEGSCRACTVLLDDRPVASCQVAIADMDGKHVTTIESLQTGDTLHALQEAFIAEQAMQCGYCVPGMIMTALALLRTHPQPTRTEIAEWMNGNLCRCCNYVNILNAIEAAATRLSNKAPSP